MTDQLETFKRLLAQSEECLAQARAATDVAWAKVWVTIANEYRELAEVAERERL
jgi:hypothetical protein